MSNIDALMEHAEQNCKARGKQLTVKRKQVLYGLLHSERALSAYELIDYCKEQFEQSLQAMSVYRILEFLEQEHLVHKLKVSNKYVACSHILCDHEHGVPQFLICSKCNKIRELTIEQGMITHLQANARQEGFTVISPQLEINCVCDECIKS
ncbi:transcriptional repressor [Photobacterium sp. BZF1]|uniref:Fur family transcriptional regulator n=1 Tax=Photobacterium sp. BZF1 TaxID=1904457 RepID=UPI0016538DCB|nr:transcriptional repressor [Photobacterium sp. BZF1]MBC7003170.1 transcriptional repressor [Photobacterium sp. BZF1]